MTYQIKNILWATDFSYESTTALAYASYLSNHYKAKITALHVVPDFAPALYETRGVVVAELIAKQEKSREKAFKKLQKLSEQKGIKFAKIIVETGSAGAKIPEVAEKEKCQLIAIGRKGMSALEKIFIGSVANQVLRRSKVPVLVSPRRRGTPKVENILVPTDFSEAEERERNYAWMLASTLKANLTMLYILELYDFKFSPAEVKKMMDEALKKLKSSKKKKGNFEINEAVVRDLNAPAGIVTYAAKHQFDLIVMSTCVSPLERFFLGSTTEKVIAYSTVPVLALPAAYCKR
ncbi:MAG: universal stress protein [Acidobacteriota bacterium]|nr:universal stress protein [Acidobacteriota bacterium]MDW3228368.1 universal stress protein [Acidobacteriota bacterium]MDY0231963.1 universal stress protein [Candidatus Saccharicenans sp.]